MLHPNLTKSAGLPARPQEAAQGVYLKDLAEGAVLDIQTQHCQYRLVMGADTHVRLSGHPMFCPEPIEVNIEGSIARRQSLVPSPGFIGRGMYLVYKHPGFDRIITTSRILGVRKLD